MVCVRQVLASALVMATGWLSVAGLSGCAVPVASRPVADYEKAGLQPLWERKIAIMPGRRW